MTNTTNKKMTNREQNYTGTGAGHNECSTNHALYN